MKLHWQILDLYAPKVNLILFCIVCITPPSPPKANSTFLSLPLYLEHEQSFNTTALALLHAMQLSINPLSANRKMVKQT